MLHVYHYGAYYQVIHLNLSQFPSSPASTHVKHDIPDRTITLTTWPEFGKWLGVSYDRLSDINTICIDTSTVAASLNNQQLVGHQV